MDVYTAVKYVHILLAIVAVGFNMSYGFWLARAHREPEHLGHVLKGLKVLDDRFATPAYVLLLVTGAMMLFVSGLALSTFWIATALVLYCAMAATAVFGYSPTLRRQIAEVEAGRAGTPGYRALAARARNIGFVLGCFVVAIVFLMVVKPQP